MLIKDIMTKNPVTVVSGTSVTDAKKLMTQHNISKLPVVDKAGALVGILTKNDLTKAAPSDATTLDMYELSYLLSKLTVDKVMVKSVKTVVESETVEEAARIMDDYNIGCLPVMENKVLVGIITESDLFKTFIQFFNTAESGIRVTFKADNKPGELSTICKGLVKKNANIVSLVTFGAEGNSIFVTAKITGINQQEVEEVLAENGSAIVDIRSV